VNQQDFCYFNSEALSAKSHLKFACLLAMHLRQDQIKTYTEKRLIKNLALMI
jgi:hypothetical protein